MPDITIVVQPQPEVVANVINQTVSSIAIGVPGAQGPEGPQGPAGGAAGLTAGYVQSLIAGTNIQVSSASGDVTVTNTLSVAGLESATSSLQSQIDSLEGATANLNSKDSALASGTGANASAISSLQSATGTLNTRVSGLETATGNLNSHLTGTDSGTGTNASAISSLQSATGVLNSHLTGTDSGTASNLSRIGSLESATAVLNSKDSALASGTGANASAISSLQSATGTLQTLIDGLESATAALDSKDTALASGTASNLSRIQSLESTTGNFAVTGSNIGSGVGVFVTKVGNELRYKTLVAGSSVGITESASSLSISASTSGGGEVNTASNTGDGVGVYKEKVGVDLVFKTLSAGSNIGITVGTNELTISGAATVGSGGGLPYPEGATAGVNLQTYGLTASSISSFGGITGTTISAVTVLAGNFMTSTASLQSAIDSLETTTGTMQTLIDGLEAASASHDVRIGSLETTTATMQGFIDGLETATANLNSWLNTGTANVQSAVDSLETTTASMNSWLNTGTANLQSQVSSLWNSKLPYTGATADVSLRGVTVSGRIESTSGLDLNWTPVDGNQTKWLKGVWIPREPDIQNLRVLDWQDEYAYLDKRSGSAVITPTPTDYSSGTLLGNCIFRDETAYLYWSTDPFPISITVDTSSRSITHKNNATFQVGLTFRGIITGITAMSVDFWSITSNDWYRVGTVTPTFTDGDRYYVFPRYTESAGNSYNHYKMRLGISGIWANQGGNQLRIQRIQFYHDSHTLDPWHLHIGGGEVFGSVTAPALSATTISASTVSAGTLLAGNFMVATASLQSAIDSLETTTGTMQTLIDGLETASANHESRIGSLETTTGTLQTLIDGLESATATFNTEISGLETATGNLNSWLNTGTGNLQSQVSSLWNSKVPYTGASASVNLTQYSLTAASVSSLTYRFGDGSSQTGAANMVVTRNSSIGTAITGSLSSSMPQTVMMWRAPYACTLSAIYVHFKGSGSGDGSALSGAFNARKNATDSHIATTLTAGISGGWIKATIQNTDYVAGDYLEAQFIGATGQVYHMALQADFIRA